jgi:hypothetical protein
MVADRQFKRLTKTIFPASAKWSGGSPIFMRFVARIRHKGVSPDILYRLWRVD